MLNDFLLFGKIKDGNVGAFETLFRLYYLPLCRYAASLTGRTDVAEDVVQDVFFLLWKERAAWHVRCSVGSYLYGAVRNQSLRYLEKERLHERYSAGMPSADAEPSPHDWMEYNELQRIIDQTLEVLPDRRRQIFRMHRMDGLKYSEIAGRLNVSIKTVEAEMTKAGRQLKHNVEKYYKNRS